MTTNTCFRQIISQAIIAGCFCLYSIGAACQEATANSAKAKFPPAVFINSQRVNYAITYLDPNNLENIEVVSGIDSVNKTSGSIYLTTKSPYQPPLTLADISRGQAGFNANNKNIVYIIDDKVIADPLMVRMDSSIILRIQAVNSTDISYLAKSGDPFGILVISTKLKFKEPQKGQIRLQ